MLTTIWERQDWPDRENISLLAVGGYGRGELLPHSDVDLLILTRASGHQAYRDQIARFTALLWDIGLDIGQSVRSIRQCKSAARDDLTIATTLMESRTLAGPEELREEMARRNRPRRHLADTEIPSRQTGGTKLQARKNTTTSIMPSSPTSRPPPAACAIFKP